MARRSLHLRGGELAVARDAVLDLVGEDEHRDAQVLRQRGDQRVLVVLRAVTRTVGTEHGGPGRHAAQRLRALPRQAPAESASAGHLCVPQHAVQNLLRGLLRRRAGHVSGPGIVRRSACVRTRRHCPGVRGGKGGKRMCPRWGHADLAQLSNPRKPQWYARMGRLGVIAVSMRSQLDGARVRSVCGGHDGSAVAAKPVLVSCPVSSQVLGGYQITLRYAPASYLRRARPQTPCERAGEGLPAFRTRRARRCARGRRNTSCL